MYVPDLARVSPSAAGLPQAEEVMLTTADGERLVAWHVAPQPDGPVILYLQGNGGALRHRVHRFAQLLQLGLGVFAVSYRGFGGSFTSAAEVARRSYPLIPISLLMKDQFRSDWERHSPLRCRSGTHAEDGVKRMTVGTSANGTLRHFAALQRRVRS